MTRLLLSLLGLALSVPTVAAADGNRLAYLDDNSPFWPTAKSPKFTTPQWVGEPGVEAVVILAIDDMKDPAKYEAFLRPILDRLKKIDGRAPVSIMANNVAPEDPQLQAWLKEGLSLEVHTLMHPCPCLGRGTFDEAKHTYHGGVELLASIPGNRPVAYRMPCCDSMNSASPRFFAEVFNRANEKGQYLAVDSSVFVRWKDARFDKYYPAELRPPSKVSLRDYAGYIEEYSYPFVIGKQCWEFPCAAPSDWQAFNVLGSKSAEVLADWKAVLDRIVRAQGVMTAVFHPHGWSSPEQWVEFIDYAEQTYGKRVKFLTFREALERVEKNALLGWPLRAPKNGGDNGVRLLDVNNDGYMDVLTSRGEEDLTRVWVPAENRWQEARTPFAMALPHKGRQVDTGAHFAVLDADGAATLVKTTISLAAWTWREGAWKRATDRILSLVPKIDLPGNGIDSGVRFRDFDGDGICELLANRQVYRWSESDKKWEEDFALPAGCSVLDTKGRDAGLRFADLNGDGFDDVLFSNEVGYSIHLWATKVRADLGWKKGWPHLVVRKLRGEEGWSATSTPDEMPPFVLDGQNNGAWFQGARLAVQNEDTVKLEAHTWIRNFKELIAYPVPTAKSPEESLKCFVPRPGFTVELVAAEPLVESPVAFDWDAQGRLWVVEMRDYPLGMDGKGKPGGRIKLLTDEDGDGRYDKAVIFAEDLPFPTGIVPSEDGVIVSAAPDILFLADKDGDGRADARRVLFTGFTAGNQQHRMNGFEWGLDGWLYGGNGDSGGTIVPGETKPGGPPAKGVNISGRDLKFLPDGSAFQAESGQAQFGRRRDDWGQWFANNNSTWLWHYTIEDHYLRRNPKLAVKSVRQPLAAHPEGQRVYPAYALDASPTRMNQPQSLGYTTAACSPTPYRDDLFGPNFATSVFISEPMYNVVHREVLAPNGATFTSKRAPNEQDREFLASTDLWFRPTMLKTGPDGALYVADFYRFVLEHPEWIAPETQARLDLRGGADKGRIYRVFPTDKKPRPIPNLAKLTTPELVRAMDSPSGWQRDTVQRMLPGRTLGREPKADSTLREVLAKAVNPKVRAQIVAAMGVSTRGRGYPQDVLRTGLRDPHPQVRVQALRAAEQFADEVAQRIHLELILACERDPEFIVRRQLAFTLGEFRGGETESVALTALDRMAEREGANEQMRVAILSSLKPEDALFAKLNTPPPAAAAQAPNLALPPASPDRARVIASYAKVAGLKGDAARGRELFKAQCALCHRLKGDGFEVGPDLGMVADKADDWLLAALFDPNAAIEARYQAQLVKLKSGAELSGLLAAETANNLTLRLPGGSEHAVLRSAIATEKSLGRSLMPEGLEGALDAQAVADLFAWLRAK